MDRDTIRIVETLPEDLEAGNTQHVVRVFGQISQRPGDARQLRGRVFLGFPSYDDDPRPNWRIPAIRTFVRRLHDQLPHFPYFLIPDVALEAPLVYMLCLVDVREDGAFVPAALIQTVERVEGDVREFCDRIADDPESVVNGLYLTLPAQLLVHAPALRTRALTALARSFPLFLSAGPEASPLRSVVIARAEGLSGISRSDHPDDASFFSAVEATLPA